LHVLLPFLALLSFFGHCIACPLVLKAIIYKTVFSKILVSEEKLEDAKRGTKWKKDMQYNDPKRRKGQEKEEGHAIQ
jgi:hypothetical protein